jgi:hypothetical protein
MAAADEERALAEAALVRITMTTMPDCPATGYLKEGVANSTIEENAPQRRVYDRRWRGSLGENGEIAG